MPGVLMLVRYFVLRSVACALVSHTCRPRAFWRRGRASIQSGGYSGGVPPLPIPNREVKPVIADGTAMQCGRVGSRLLSVERFPKREVSPFFMSYSRVVSLLIFYLSSGRESC